MSQPLLDIASTDTVLVVQFAYRLSKYYESFENPPALLLIWSFGVESREGTS